jgi:hypothetical protein
LLCCSLFQTCYATDPNNIPELFVIGYFNSTKNKVEKWTRDGSKVDRMLYAGNSLDKARECSPPRSGTGR